MSDPTTELDALALVASFGLALPALVILATVLLIALAPRSL